MRLSELVSQMTPNELTQIALLLFLAVFVAVTVRAFLTRREEHERAASLPLDDGAP